MRELERRPTELLVASDNLRKLIIENPGLPLLVFAGDDCNSGNYSYMTCSSCWAEVGEFLDCMQEVNDERVYTDRDEFKDALDDHLFDALEDGWHGTDEDWDAYVEQKLAEYEPYWRKAIIFYVDN